MARKSLIEREKKKIKLVAKHAEKRSAFKEKRQHLKKKWRFRGNYKSFLGIQIHHES